jgi:alcohol dehydrogenase
MVEREPDNIALDKYARLGEVLCQKRHGSKEKARKALVELLNEWTEAMRLPRLSQYDVSEEHLDKIVLHSRGSSMKTNPLVLSDDEIKQVLQMRL